MSNRTLPKWPIAVIGALVLVGLAMFGLHAWRKTGTEVDRTFASPDGRFQIVVFRTASRFAMPGQSSDAPGYFQLRDARTGRVLRERSVEMVQFIERVE